jgi:uncharacterized protein DUF3551
MKRMPVIIASTVTAALGALSVAAFSSTAASAGEYCRRDVTAFMMSCSFSSMEQCEETSSGRGGDCLRDPFLSDARSAYAYQPGLSKRTGRAHRVQSEVR